MRVEPAEAVLQEPVFGDVLVRVGQKHQHGDEPAIDEDEASFLVAGAGLDEHRLQWTATLSLTGFARPAVTSGVRMP